MRPSPSPSPAPPDTARIRGSPVRNRGPNQPTHPGTAPDYPDFGGWSSPTIESGQLEAEGLVEAAGGGAVVLDGQVDVAGGGGGDDRAGRRRRGGRGRRPGHARRRGRRCSRGSPRRRAGPGRRRTRGTGDRPRRRAHGTSRRAGRAGGAPWWRTSRGTPRRAPDGWSPDRRAVAGRTSAAGSGHASAAAADGVDVVDLARGAAPALRERGHPDVGDVGGDLDQSSMPAGSCSSTASSSGRAQRAQASSSPTTQGPRIHARPSSASHSTMDAGDEPAAPRGPPARWTPSPARGRRARRRCPRARRRAWWCRGRGGPARPRSGPAPRRARPARRGDVVHAPSSFNRSAADRLPGSAPAAAIRQETSRRKSLTGVGTPWRRPSREISPFR